MPKNGKQPAKGSVFFSSGALRDVMDSDASTRTPKRIKLSDGNVFHVDMHCFKRANQILSKTYPGRRDAAMSGKAGKVGKFFAALQVKKHEGTGGMTGYDPGVERELKSALADRYWQFELCPLQTTFWNKPSYGWGKGRRAAPPPVYEDSSEYSDSSDDDD